MEVLPKHHTFMITAYVLRPISGHYEWKGAFTPTNHEMDTKNSPKLWMRKLVTRYTLPEISPQNEEMIRA